MHFVSDSPTQTSHLGEALGALLQPGDLVCLCGGLGAGKTWLAAAIGRGWGALQPLTSPTFTLIHEHRRSGDDSVLFHVDCYRLRDAAEALQAGLGPALAGSGPTLIEWPGRIGEALPHEGLWVTLEITGPEQRRIRLRGIGARHQGLLRQLQVPEA